jgi:hypothetical protein
VLLVGAFAFIFWFAFTYLALKPHEALAAYRG